MLKMLKCCAHTTQIHMIDTQHFCPFVFCIFLSKQMYKRQMTRRKGAYKRMPIRLRSIRYTCARITDTRKGAHKKDDECRTDVCVTYKKDASDTHSYDTPSDTDAHTTQIRTICGQFVSCALLCNYTPSMVCICVVCDTDTHHIRCVQSCARHVAEYSLFCRALSQKRPIISDALKFFLNLCFAHYCVYRCIRHKYGVATIRRLLKIIGLCCRI